MRRKILIFIFFLSFFCAKQDKSYNYLPQYTTPQKTVETYWKALFEKRYKDALVCFADFQEKDFDAKDIMPLPICDSLWIDSIISLKITKDRAEIHYAVAFKFDTLEKTIEKTIITGDKLILTSEGWKISDVIVPTK